KAEFEVLPNWPILQVAYGTLRMHERPCAYTFCRLTAKEPLLALFTGEQGGSSASQRLKACERLKLSGERWRLCRRDPGVAETLLAALRGDRWSCELSERHRQNLLKRAFRETAFLFALSAAGLAHAVARACSRGRLERCTCDEAPGLRNRQAWQWGGCGDNLRYGAKFARTFLLHGEASKDLRAGIDRHNTRVGIKVVRRGMQTTCKCHGVSGSCTVRTCWRQLAPFTEMGRSLKQRYDVAVKVLSMTNEAAGERTIARSRRRPREQRGQRRPKISDGALTPRGIDLVYVEDSPSYCRASRYSPGTANRSCQKGRNCDSICCGRGYNTRVSSVHKPCQCQVHWCCYVQCEQCLHREETYSCKEG
uniref:Protein Wnt n=1 Tax=Eptatretus burgeri TaxID=7764 RepID=A0A8C4QHH4_EPTBU